MKLALECPTEMLDIVQPFADFEWVLANLYLENEKYAKFYQESTRPKYLDNGVTETGEPVPLEDIEQIANEINADFIVARDWIGDFARTVAGYAETLKHFGAGKVVGVLQGSTPIEALKCVPYYKQSPVLLVPYHVGGSDRKRNPELMALKRALVVSNLPADRYIHLLGFTTLDELLWYETMPNVASMDTDVPVKAGLAEVEIEEFDRATDISKVQLTKDNYFTVVRNLALLRTYMS